MEEKKKKKEGEVFVDVNTQQFNPVLVAVSYWIYIMSRYF